ILSRLDLPPFYFILSKVIYFNLKGDFIGREMAENERSFKERSLIIGEFFSYLHHDNYRVKKTAANILAGFKDPLCLIPIKNILIQREKFTDSHLLYFLLDILSVFDEQAADFSELLKKIIRKNSDQWLKYHALKAYQSTAYNDRDYQKFKAEIRENEREPVTLALKD
ncbi:MAG: hypothetical protein UMU04_01765, partial [Halanaerobiales bacterium]|nr:hypothetical protein [Halanaerobiales bacterium]